MTPTDYNDTICAISTPPGVGGIAVARISGPQAFEIVDKVWRGRSLESAESHTAHLGTVVTADGQPLDQAVATVYRAPRSFTGDNVVEIAVHGSRFVQQELIATLTAKGARLAEPGEFTRRAFAAGKMDLAEAEAVADVIASDSRAAHRIAISQMRGGFSRRIEALRSQLVDLSALLELELDFSEEDVEFASRSRLRELAYQLNAEIRSLHGSFAAGNAIKEGIPVAIVGVTNAGKSSLLNALLGDDRAIVSNIHGTTRDTIEETLHLGDYLYRFIDTAGLRDTADEIERIGIERSRRALAKARIAIVVIDPTADITGDQLQILSQITAPHIIISVNKIDIATEDALAAMTTAIAEVLRTNDLQADMVEISASSEQGLDTLRKALIEAAAADEGTADEGIMVTNARHAAALAAAAESTDRLLQGLDANLPGDLLAQDLRQTLDQLSTITGQIPSTEILSTIFSRFCIGK